MRKFQHSKQKSFLDSSNGHEESSFLLKIICADGVVVSDRLVFILWSKQLRQLLDPDEETSVLIFPDVKQRSMELLLNLLRKGNTSGYESDFEDLFELAIEFFEDFPGGFSNFETSDKSFEEKAVSLRSKRKKRNTFKTLRNHTCEFCLSTFFNKQTKDRHIENCHKPKEKYVCTRCKWSFKSKMGLVTHEKIKHGSVKYHNCNICDTKFSNEANLKRHIRSVHEKKFTCLVCQEVFDCKRKLERHKRHFFHFQEKEEIKDVFSCDNCDFKTSRKDSLLRHKRLKHGIFRKEFLAIDKTLQESSSWTCLKCNKTLTEIEDIEDHVIICEDFRCKLCDKTFTTNSSLKRHLEKKHTSVCKNCNERFKTNKHLRKHQEGCMRVHKFEEASKDDIIEKASKNDKNEKASKDDEIEKASKDDKIEKATRYDANEEAFKGDEFEKESNDDG